MSALWKYVDALKRQQLMMEAAKLYDGLTLDPSFKSLVGRRRRTRRDAKRADMQYAMDLEREYPAQFPQLKKPAMSRHGCVGTLSRVDGCLRIFSRSLPALHSEALAEAQTLGIYNHVVEPVRCATKSHEQLLAVYRGECGSNLRDAEALHSSAIEHLKEYLPAKTTEPVETAKGARRGRRKGSKTPDTVQIEASLAAGATIDSIADDFGKTRDAIEKIRDRWLAKRPPIES
jgi:hypothetical protein